MISLLETMHSNCNEHETCESVLQMTSIGSVIATVWATDLDPSDSGVLFYSIDEASSPYAVSRFLFIVSVLYSIHIASKRILKYKPPSHFHIIY